jgi:hypothetical protein
MPATLRGFRLGGATAVLTCLLAMGSFAAPAWADDDDAAADKPRSYPYVAGEASVEFQHDRIDIDGDSDITDTYNTTELEIGVYFSPFFSVHGSFTFEPVLDAEAGDDRFFEDHGLYAEELYAKFSFKPFDVKAGKYNPAFGSAFDETPGIYGTDLAEDYELTERVGLAISAEREGTPFGKVTLTASTFFADTSFLSDSAFTRRGRTDRDDGGLSNTENLDSFAFSIEGEDIPGFAGLKYNIGFVHQAAGIDDLDDQNGFVFGLKQTRSFNNVELQLIGETAYFDYGGNLYDADDDEEFVDSLWYWTLGGQLTFNDKYRINTAYTARNAELFDGTNFDDFQWTASGGMKVWREWWLEAGYKYLEEADEESHTVGLKLSKTFEFDTGSLEPAMK